MSNQEEEPLWRFLPYAPERFFKLEKGFSRVDLKRAYNHWIRRFKPEQHPAEFQRIREAYQRLERRLLNGEFDQTSEMEEDETPDAVLPEQREQDAHRCPRT